MTNRERALIVLVILVGLFAFTWVAHGRGFTTFQGGTGTTSPSGILYGDETIRLKTTTIGSGLTFSGGTLLATGGSGSVATSTADVDTYVTFFTSNSATPATIGGEAGFTYDDATNLFTFPNATGTQQTLSEKLYFPNTGFSNTSPNLTFAGDTDTGWYFDTGTSRPAITVDGTKVIEFANNEVRSYGFLFAADGSASKVGVGFGNDQNTGIYRAAGDVLGLGAGGVEAIRITEVGSAISDFDINVADGGLDLPNYSDGVLVVGSGSVTARTDLGASEISDVYLFNNADDSTTGSLTATEFVASDGAATSTFAGGLTVQSTGLVVQDGSLNVGIATSSPDRLLEIDVTGGGNPNGILVTGDDDIGNTIMLELKRTNDSPILRYTGQFRTWDMTAGSLFTFNDESSSGIEFTVASGGNLRLGNGGSVSASLQLERRTGDPSTSTDDAFVYAKDVSSSAEVFVMDEGGTATQISPHNPRTGEWWINSTKDGQRTVILSEQAIEALEELTGDDFILRFDEGEKMPEPKESRGLIERMWDKITGNTERIEQLENQVKELEARLDKAGI